MTKILFICHGNICRSPMAEFIMKDLVRQRGLEDDFYIASCATSTEEIGCPVYPPARAELAKHGIGCAGKTAVQLTKADYDKYDMLVIMDERNAKNAARILGGDPERKISKLLDHTCTGGDVADPWYCGNFDKTYSDILRGCRGILDELTAAK